MNDEVTQDISAAAFMDAIEENPEESNLEEGIDDEKLEAPDSEEELDQDEPEEDEDGEDEEDEEDDSEEEEADDEEKSEGKERNKTWKVTKKDGTQVEVKDEDVVKLKIDGSYQKVTQRDLIDNYRGQVKYDEQVRRHAELNKTAQAELATAKRENEQIVASTEDFLTSLTEGNLMKAVGILTELKGDDTDPSKVINELTAGIGEFINEFATLTPEQIKQRTDDYEREHKVKQLETRKEALEREEQERHVTAAIKTACEENELEEEQFNQAYQAYVERNQERKGDGKAPIDFTLNDVVSLASDWKIKDGVEDAAERLGVNLEETDSLYLVNIVRAEEGKNGTRLDKKDYVRLIKAYAKEEVEQLSRKVSPKGKTNSKSKKETVREITRAAQVWD